MTRIQAWREDPDQQRLLSRLGGTPRSRLEWLLGQFLPADLSHASARAWGDWMLLAEVYPNLGSARWIPPSRRGEAVRFATRSKASPGLSEEDRQLLRRASAQFAFAIYRRRATASDRMELLDCQRRLDRLLRALVSARLWRGYLGALELICRVEPTTPRTPASMRLTQRFSGSLFARMTLATLDYVKQVGVTRVRRCPYPEDPGAPEQCARLFVASRRQRYCSREHTRKAMYLRWLRRGAPRGTRGPRSPRRNASASP
jgi:hypothetical protein